MSKHRVLSFNTKSPSGEHDPAPGLNPIAFSRCLDHDVVEFHRNPTVRETLRRFGQYYIADEMKRALVESPKIPDAIVVQLLKAKI
jgi:hypothetical protein